MRIQSVETTGVKLFGDRKLDFRDRTGRPAQVIVLTGGEGTGKTLLLELIAAAKESVAPYGALPDNKRFLAAEGEPAKVALEWFLTDDEAGDMDRTDAVRLTEAMWGGPLSLAAENDADMIRLLARYDSEAPSAKVLYFNATRSLSVGANPGGGKHARLALTNDSAKFEGLDAHVTELCLDGVARLASEQPSALLARFINTFSSLCSSVSLHGLARTRAGIQPTFLRGTTELPVAELSHSEREAFLLAGTLCRSAVARSVILLDEPELHCSPARLIGKLRALIAFDPSNQWIVSTSHRAIANELASDGVVVDLGGAQ